VEIWNRRGDIARTVAEIPSREGVTLTGVRTGPRDYRWRPDQPATLLWIEALDGGDLKNKVPFRDKIVTVDAVKGLGNRPGARYLIGSHADYYLGIQGPPWPSNRSSRLATAR